MLSVSARPVGRRGPGGPPLRIGPVLGLRRLEEAQRRPGVLRPMIVVVITEVVVVVVVVVVAAHSLGSLDAAKSRSRRAPGPAGGFHVRRPARSSVSSH